MTSSPVNVTWFMFTERCSTQEWHEGNHVQSRHIYWLSTVVPPSCSYPAEPSVTTISGCEKHSALYNVVPTTGNNKLDMSPDMNIKSSKRAECHVCVEAICNFTRRVLFVHWNLPLLPKPERTHSDLSRATAVLHLVHLEATRKLAMGRGGGHS